MITIFASVAEGPERNYSRIGNIYQMILNPANISYIIVTEHIIAMNNGTFLSVAAAELKRITLRIAPELA
jgi:hypothetical protein